MSHTAGKKDDVRQHSGWLIPLALLFVILLLSGLFLGWYLRPGLKAGAAPTGQSTLVPLTVQGVRFAVPANYIENASVRAGGDQDSVTLAALFPGMRGYSQQDSALFAGNAPDSPVVRLTLRGDDRNLDGRARLARIYSPYIEGKGVGGPFDLTQYGFVKTSGYARSDLFVGKTGDALALLLCEKPAPDLPSPNCIAIDRPLRHGLGYTYRFKRAYLSRWREMATGVTDLIARFETKRD